MRVYTVHYRPDAALSERDAVLVKEGFCWPAFFAGILWALWHRMWLTALVFLLIAVVVEAVAELAGLDPLSGATLSLAIALLIGWSANDLRRRALVRRGYDMSGIVAATGEDAAARRWYDLNPPATASGH
jgi:hypothetical protein